MTCGIGKLFFHFFRERKREREIKRDRERERERERESFVSSTWLSWGGEGGGEDT